MFVTIERMKIEIEDDHTESENGMENGMEESEKRNEKGINGEEMDGTDHDQEGMDDLHHYVDIITSFDIPSFLKHIQSIPKAVQLGEYGYQM